MSDAPAPLGLGQGLHEGIAEEQYHADLLCDEPTLSRSIARLLLDKSPLHAWTAHPRLNPAYRAKRTDTLDVGRAIHALALTNVDLCDVIDASDWKTKAAQEARDKSHQLGRVPVLPAQYKMISDMAEALQPFLVDLPEARREVTGIYRDAGVLCRVRFDFLPHDPAAPIYDYKTTTDATPQAFARAAWRYGYDLQAAWYARAHKVLRGYAPGGFIFIAQEKAPPYAVTLHRLTDGAYEYAERRCDEALTTWGRCLRLNDWPSYEPIIHEITAPPWSFDRDEDLIFSEAPE